MGQTCSAQTWVTEALAGTWGTDDTYESPQRGSHRRRRAVALPDSSLNSPLLDSAPTDTQAAGRPVRRYQMKRKAATTRRCPTQGPQWLPEV